MTYFKIQFYTRAWHYPFDIGDVICEKEPDAWQTKYNYRIIRFDEKHNCLWIRYVPRWDHDVAGNDGEWAIPKRNFHLYEKFKK